ncbi:hypothetical protein E2320_009834, partial [Naja naja]
MSSLRGSQVTH